MAKALVILVILFGLCGMCSWIGSLSGPVEETPTVTAKPTQKQTEAPKPTKDADKELVASYKDSFMSGCDKDGTYERLCSCMFDNVFKGMNSSQIIKKIEKGLSDQEMQDVAIKCIQ